MAETSKLEKHRPTLGQYAQTHTDLIDLHRRVRDQSQPPIQYWFCIQQDYGNTQPGPVKITP